MAAMVEIKFDEKQLRNVQKMLSGVPKELPKVTSRSINKTVATVRTHMARQITPKINAELSAVAALQKKSGRKVAGKVSQKTGKVRRFRFTIKAIKNNISFQKATTKIWQGLIWIKQFKGQEAQETAETPFIAKMPKSGHISIFRRLGSARIPIADQLRRLMRMHFAGMRESVKRFAQQTFYKNISSQVKLALDKWKAKAKKAA